MEIRGYQSIWRLLARRPRVPERAHGFSYHDPILPALAVFLVVSAVEVAIVDVVLHRWPVVRFPLLVLGLWGLLWMFGMLSGVLTRPHSVGPHGIRVRYGPEVDISLAWDDIESVERRPHTRNGKEPDVVVDQAGNRAFHQRVNDQTNRVITLVAPTEIRLPRGIEVVSSIALYADDPRAFLDEVRRVAGAPEPVAAG